MSELMPEINNPTPNPSKKSKKGLKIALIVALLGLVLSPLDIIPDAIPVVGWIDDIGYLLGIIGTVISLVTGRKKEQ